ncbi:Zinc finger, UBP-type [Corchorus olitorius]|uniref:Zinc finger, UBP-type n=1 Tax=Corchorus olitorius TaxID=93759 RepID=A0A1R3I4P7_9ROSI|nr:Zinc finger, UBP-type [Corchorus olitorius]
MSSSSSTVTGDDKFRQPETVIDADFSASTMSTEAIPFSSGNPRIEETRGVMHLFSNDAVSPLPVERKPFVSVLGVPNHMTYADFCQFCASFIHHIMEMRIVRNDGMDDRYSVVMTFESQDSADRFYHHFNNRQFNSLEEEVCRVLFTVDVQFTGYSGSVDCVQSPPASSTEQPSCPVCLERLDQGTSGILTTICNHSFHCSCISKWTDSSCPVCRYCQQQPEKSTCFICQTSENLWLCVICGFVGCGRSKGGHAIIHWKETQHCYSLEVETNRVWDYVGDNYVHRLIQSKTDGKLIELKSHCVHANDGCGSCDCVDSGIDEDIFQAEIVNEYNELLRTQLENQKLELWKAKLLEVEEREKKSLRMKDDKIQALQEQLSDLMAHLEAGEAVERLSISNKTNDSTVL